MTGGIASSREFALAGALVLLFAVFSVTVDGFLDGYSLFEQSRYWVITGLIAIPMTFIIATAGIDLSVGSILALSGIVMGLLYHDAQWPMAAAALAGVAAGTAAGAVNGVVGSYLRVPPLVVTLATMALFRGLAMGLSQGSPITGFPDGFTWLSQGDLFSVPVGGGERAFVPFSLAVLVVAGGVGMVLMHKTWVGRFTQCIGENETAAAFAAINVRLLKCLLYTICGLVCGVAALFQSALYATAKADTALGLELEVIACVVVGGTRISGGQGSVLGSLLGLLIIGILRYGLVMAEVATTYVIIIVGSLVIVTAVFNEWMALRQGGRA